METTSPPFFEPYSESTTNFIYNLLFCDNPDLFKSKIELPYAYPFDILFSDSTSKNDLEKIVQDAEMDVRVKVLATNKLRTIGHPTSTKELFAVIIEVALDNGLDVLASFSDGTARYLNQTGKIIISETSDDKSLALTRDLFDKGANIVNQIGPWDQPRLAHPSNGMTRITFLVSDGLYFGQAPTDVLFNDPLAGPALMAGTHLMRYLIEKATP